jgi:hypothetical protein
VYLFDLIGFEGGHGLYGQFRLTGTDFFLLVAAASVKPCIMLSYTLILCPPILGCVPACHPLPLPLKSYAYFAQFSSSLDYAPALGFCNRVSCS